MTSSTHDRQENSGTPAKPMPLSSYEGPSRVLIQQSRTLGADEHPDDVLAGLRAVKWCVFAAIVQENNGTLRAVGYYDIGDEARKGGHFTGQRLALG